MRTQHRLAWLSSCVYFSCHALRAKPFASSSSGHFFFFLSLLSPLFFFPEVLVPDLCARCCTRLPCRTCFIAPAHLSSCVCVSVIWLQPAGGQVLPQPAAPSLVFVCLCVCVHLPGVSVCNLAGLCAVIKSQLPPHFSATWRGTKAAPGRRD